MENELKFKVIREVKGALTHEYAICEDCYKEGKIVEPLPVKDMGQWVILYECPSCHRKCEDTNFRQMQMDMGEY